MSPENFIKLTLVISKMYNSERMLGEMSGAGPFKYCGSIQLVGI
jgi:hypothetical protein